MKNFFEFFGFLSTACISAALIFIFIGKKDGLKSDSKGGFLTEMGADAEIPDAPRSISDRPMRSNSVAGNKRDRSNRPDASAPELAPEERLKSLYNDNEFVTSTAKQWKGLVQDAADEYNVKPQVLLAHVLVQSYLNEYSRTQLYNDAARHAGERVKPTSAAIKGYRYSWSMQKLLNEHDLTRYFPEDIAASRTVAASVGNTSRKLAPSAGTKSTSKSSAPMAKTNPLEEGFKNMVSKEYGFTSWAGLQKLADPETKSEAARRVKSLMMASRVR